jgi:hypothetical protein
VHIKVLETGAHHLDTNVQGIDRADKCVWKRGKQYDIDAKRNETITARRLFGCNGSAKVYQTSSERPDNLLTQSAASTCISM